MRRIAITGGLASGKSAVGQILRELGAFVVDADAIVHELLTPNTSVGQQVLNLFGKGLLKEEKIDKTVLAAKVFKHPEHLHALEQIIHPAVLTRIEELYREAEKLGTYRAFVVEMPLLFEINQEANYDFILVVLADESLCRERFRAAGHSNEEYDLRMKRQISPEEKALRADLVIRNNGSLSHLRKQITQSEKRFFFHE